jgi:hypothetical protein
MRSKGNLKPSLPCLDDPVTKLEGLGEKTRRNLLDVRACAATLDFAGAIPEECPNSVTTGKPVVLWQMHQLHSLHTDAGTSNQQLVLTAWIISVSQ